MFPKLGLGSYEADRCRTVGVGDFPTIEALGQAISNDFEKREDEKVETFHIYFYGEDNPEFIEFQKTIQNEFAEGEEKEKRALLASGKSFNRRRIMNDKNPEKPVIIQIRLRILDGKQKKEAIAKDNMKKKIIAQGGVFVEILREARFHLVDGTWVRVRSLPQAN